MLFSPKLLAVVGLVVAVSAVPLDTRGRSGYNGIDDPPVIDARGRSGYNGVDDPPVNDKRSTVFIDTRGRGGYNIIDDPPVDEKRSPIVTVITDHLEKQ